MATISGSIRVTLLNYVPLVICGRLASAERGANLIDDAKALEVAVKSAEKKELETFKFGMFIFDCVVPLYATLALNRCFTINMQQSLDASSLAFYGCEKTELSELCEYLTAASKIIEKNNARELVPCNFLIRSSYAFNLLDLLNSRKILEKHNVTHSILNEFIRHISRTEWKKILEVLNMV